MQTCSACGQTFGLTHSCPGAMATAPDAAAAWVPPKGFALGYYFRLALGIARLDDGAILAASRDENSLAYGAMIWLGAFFVVLMVPIAMAGRAGRGINWPVSIMVVGVMLAVGAAITLVQWGICHLLARWLFAARGTYFGIVRAMLLGNLVLAFYAVPAIGNYIAGIWSIAILMRVFEEVDGIERMQAFGISLGVGIPFYILSLYLLAPKH